jgi:hypothetical protein
MSLIDVGAWALVAIGVLTGAPRLVRPAGSHAQGRDRGRWRELQLPLALAVDGVIILTPGSAEAVKWVLVGFLTLLVPVWDLTSWARSRATRRNRVGPPAEPS